MAIEGTTCINVVTVLQCLLLRSRISSQKRCEGHQKATHAEFLRSHLIANTVRSKMLAQARNTSVQVLQAEMRLQHGPELVQHCLLAVTGTVNSSHRNLLLPTATRSFMLTAYFEAGYSQAGMKRGNPGGMSPTTGSLFWVDGHD